VKKKKVKKSSASGKEYTVDECLSHFRSLPIVRKYQHISRGFAGGPEHVEIGDDQSFEAHSLRVMDYFAQVYPDKDEARDKSLIFILILTHLAKHREAYDSEHFAVFADGDQASMISVPLLRAAHYHFTRCHFSDLPSDEAMVESITAMARELSKDEKG